MRNAKALYVLLLALLAGIIAVFFAASWVIDRTPASTQHIAVANTNLLAGSVLKPEYFDLVKWPATTLPEGALSRLEAVQGRVLRTPLIKGEPVLEGKLAPPGAQGGLSGLIDEGKRAITVRVNEIVGVAGFALPGNYVDVLVNTKNDRDEPISKIVLEKIHVLAIAQETSGNPAQPKVVEAVTLEVTPDEAEKLDLARNIGTLALVLRSSTDPTDVSTRGVMRDELLGGVNGRDSVPTIAPGGQAAPLPASTIPESQARRAPRFRDAASRPERRTPSSASITAAPPRLPSLPPPAAYDLPPSAGYLPPAPPIAPPAATGVEVIHGAQRTTQQPLQ